MRCVQRKRTLSSHLFYETAGHRCQGIINENEIHGQTKVVPGSVLYPHMLHLWRQQLSTSGQTKKKQWGTTPRPRRRKRRDFDSVYYMGVHNRSGGYPPVPPVIRALVSTNLCWRSLTFEFTFCLESRFS